MYLSSPQLLLQKAADLSSVLWCICQPSAGIFCTQGDVKWHSMMQMISVNGSWKVTSRLTDTPSGNRSVEEPIWGTNSSPRCVRALMYSPQNIKVYTLVTWAELSGVNTNKSLLKIMHVWVMQEQILHSIQYWVHYFDQIFTRFWYLVWKKTLIKIS